MIRANVFRTPANTIDEIKFTVTGESIKQLQTLLNRALNCASPESEEWKDWYDLCDRIEGVPYRSHKPPVT